MTGNGTVALAITSTNSTNLAIASSEHSSGNAPELQVTYEPDPVLMVAGDISCLLGSNRTGGSSGTGSCHQQDTAFIVNNHQPAAVLALGDVQYECGGANGFEQHFDPTWGMFKSKIKPAIGNHELLLESDDSDCEDHQQGQNYVRGQDYFDYFNGEEEENGPAGPRGPDQGYYSCDLGNWHLIALNTNCSQPVCESTDDQYDCWMPT